MDLSRLLVIVAIFTANLVKNTCYSKSRGNSRWTWPQREFRGTWVATVGNLDWPSSSQLTSDQQKLELLQILDKLVELNFNAFIFQIRPTSDAFYNSSYEPWSAFLAGEQGTPPTPFYDPLQFAVEEAHARSLEIHAWFNLYRVQFDRNDTNGLAENNIALRYPQYAYPYGKALIMDPGASEIQQHIIEVFEDVLTNYDVDGIQIDDYFYPYPEQNLQFPDNTTYMDYVEKGGDLGLDDWRRENVNSLIKQISQTIKRIKPYAKFGISPFGIWKSGHPRDVSGLSAHSALYADSRKWLRDGLVDYMTPQLYWAIQSKQSFTSLLQWWLQQNSIKRHLYPGIYAGRIVVSDWSLDEILHQVEESRKVHGCCSLGNIQFRAKYFLNNTKGISDMFIGSLYQFPALLPEMDWLPKIRPPKVGGVRVAGCSVTWRSDKSGLTRSYAVYKRESWRWNLVVVVSNNIHQVCLENGSYVIKSVSRLGNENSPSKILRIKGNHCYKSF
ncbi:hypothetical protein ScPMuIL_015957 [Solemya velum]